MESRCFGWGSGAGKPRVIGWCECLHSRSLALQRWTPPAGVWGVGVWHGVRMGEECMAVNSAAGAECRMQRVHKQMGSSSLNPMQAARLTLINAWRLTPMRS